MEKLTRMAGTTQCLRQHPTFLSANLPLVYFSDQLTSSSHSVSWLLLQETSYLYAGGFLGALLYLMKEPIVCWFKPGPP